MLITFAPKNLAGFAALNWYSREPFEEAFIFHGAGELAPLRQWAKDFGEKNAPRKVAVVEIAEHESLAKLFTDDGNGSNPAVQVPPEGVITIYLKQVVPDYCLDPRPELVFYNFQLLFSGEWVSDKWIVDVTHCPPLLIGNLLYYAIKLFSAQIPIEIVAWSNPTVPPVHYPKILLGEVEQIFLNLIGQGVDTIAPLAVQFADIRHYGRSSEPWSLKFIKRLVDYGLISESIHEGVPHFRLTELGKATYQPVPNKEK